MKNYIVFFLFFLILKSFAVAKDSSETSPDAFNSSQDLEMNWQNIKSVNRLETNRLILSGCPGSNIDLVDKKYIDQRINSLHGELISLKKNINNTVSQLNFQISILTKRANSISSQLNSIKTNLSSMHSRTVGLENR